VEVVGAAREGDVVVGGDRQVSRTHVQADPGAGWRGAPRPTPRKERAAGLGDVARDRGGRSKPVWPRAIVGVGWAESGRREE
jgi:hypothetical protein